jgi:hypothetical protein
MTLSGVQNVSRVSSGWENRSHDVATTPAGLRLPVSPEKRNETGGQRNAHRNLKETRSHDPPPRGRKRRDI